MQISLVLDGQEDVAADQFALESLDVVGAVVSASSAVNQEDVAAEPYALALDSRYVVGAVVSASSRHHPSSPKKYVIVNCGSSTASSWESSPKDLAKIRVLQQRLRRSKRTIGGLKDQLACKHNDSVMKQQRRPYVATLVSLMRNRHHGSSESACAWASLLCPAYKLSRQSVCRWEVSAGTGVLASMAAFIQSHETQLQQSSRCDDPSWGASFTELIGDATKSCCWREHKLQCLQVKQTYLLGSSCESRECWPDIQVVRDASGPGCYKIVKKQLRMIQCPALDTSQSNDLGQKQLRFILINGDQGPDQQSFRKIVGLQFAECLRVIVVALPCLAHQQSLAVGRVLARLETCCTAFGFGIAYYTCLVKLTHVWRSDPALVYRVARARFGESQPADADHAKTKAPTCCASRWGSVHNVEKYFLGFSSELVCKHILSDAYFQNMSDDVEPHLAIQDVDGPPRQHLRAPTDEISLDAMKAHKQKQTKWKHDVQKGTETCEFWLMMRISNLAMGPLAHFLFFLQKHSDSTPLISLVCGGKSDEIMREFETVLTNQEVWDIELPFLDCITPAQLYGTVATLVCVGAAEYDSRVHSLISDLPLQLFWLVHCEPRTYCGQRQRVCKLVMQGNPDQLDVTTAKLKVLMPASFREGAENGKISVEDHALLVEWRKRVRESAQIVESANSVISYITKTARTIEQPLLAARFTQKQCILSHGNNTPAVLALANEVTTTYCTKQYQAIVGYSDRWLDLKDTHHPMELRPLCDAPQALQAGQASPAPERGDADIPLRRCGLFRPRNLPPGVSLAALEASAVAALRWSAAWCIDVATKCLWITKGATLEYPAAGDVAFLCVSKLRNLGKWQQLDISDEDGILVGRISIPFAFTSSAFEIANTWQWLQDRNRPSRCIICSVSLEWTSPYQAVLKGGALPVLVSDIKASDQKKQKKQSRQKPGKPTSPTKRQKKDKPRPADAQAEAEYPEHDPGDPEADEADDADMLMQDVLDADIGEEGLEMVAALAEALGVGDDDGDHGDVPAAAPDHDKMDMHVHVDPAEAQATWIEAVRKSLQALDCWQQANKQTNKQTN